MSEDKELERNLSIINTNQIKIIFGLLSYFIIVILFFVVLLLIFPDFWLVWFMILIVVVLFTIILLVNWHKQNFAYKCEICGHEFRISFLSDLLSPHGLNLRGGWKYLKCPKCYKRSKAIVIRISPNTTK